jgi:hypothetical protein
VNIRSQEGRGNERLILNSQNINVMSILIALSCILCSFNSITPPGKTGHRLCLPHCSSAAQTVDWLCFCPHYSVPHYDNGCQGKQWGVKNRPTLCCLIQKNIVYYCVSIEYVSVCIINAPPPTIPIPPEMQFALARYFPVGKNWYDAHIGSLSCTSQ